MLPVGLDLHKRYSQLEVVDDAGVRRASARLPNELEQVAGFLRSLGEPCRAVFEGRMELGIGVRLARGDRKYGEGTRSVLKSCVFHFRWSDRPGSAVKYTISGLTPFSSVCTDVARARRHGGCAKPWGVATRMGSVGPVHEKLLGSGYMKTGAILSARMAM